MELDPDFEILKRRFIYEGASLDDTRLNYLIKLIHIWVNCKDNSNSTNETFYNRTLQQLSVWEASMKKSIMVEKRIKGEIEMYETLRPKIEEKIKNLESNIQSCKQFQKEILENPDFLEIHETIETEIKKYPSCDEMKKTVLNLQSKLELTFRKQLKINEQLDCFQNQYIAVVESMNNVEFA